MNAGGRVTSARSFSQQYPDRLEKLKNKMEEIDANHALKKCEHVDTGCSILLSRLDRK